MSSQAIKAESASESLPALAVAESSFAARVRVALAAVLRLSERLAESVVAGYERLFCLDERDAADIYMHVGTDLARSGRVADARAALQTTLSIQPSNGLAWFQLGMVHLRQKATPAALEAFQRAGECGFDGFELHYRRAEALAELERYEEAASELQQALAIQPDCAEAAYRLGVALDRTKHYDEAVAALRRAIELAPREICYYQSLGFTLESAGRRDEAIDCFKRAIDLDRRAQP